MLQKIKLIDKTVLMMFRKKN